MTRRRKILLVSACGLIAVVALCFFSLRDKEPAYNGRTLSEWLDPIVFGITDPDATVTDADFHETRIAVNAIGTNAALRLLKWAAANDTPVIGFVSRHPKVPGANRLIKLAERNKNRGWIGLEILDRKGLPYLRTQLDSPDPGIRVAASRLIDFISRPPIAPNGGSAYQTPPWRDQSPPSRYQLPIK